MPGNTKIWRDTITSKLCSGRKCRKRIWFAQIVKSGAFMCFDVDPEESRILVEEELETKREMLTVALDSNHFATCADRLQFSRPSPYRKHRMFNARGRR